MKSLLNRIAVMAASAMVLGTMAYGQTEMKARVPFAFHTSNASYPAGEYTIGQQIINMGTSVTTLKGSDQKTKNFVPGGIKDYSKAGSAALVFNCSDEGGCALSEIRTPSLAVSFHVSGKNAKGKEAAAILIPLRASYAD